jgi:hypothetical protein
MDNRIIMYQILSKSLAYIAIIAMTTVAIFVVIMDVLKYWFGIDPARKETRQIKRKKQVKIRKNPVMMRFIYVHSTVPQTPENSNSILDETAF